MHSLITRHSAFTLLGLFAVSAAGQSAIYTFDNLNVGQSLVSQDGWVSAGGVSNPTVQLWDNSPASAGSLESWASRRFDSGFPGRAELASQEFTAKFDTVFIPNAPNGGSALSLFRDFDENGQLNSSAEPWISFGLDKIGSVPRLRLNSSGLDQNSEMLVGDIVSAGDQLTLELVSGSEGEQIVLSLYLENRSQAPETRHLIVSQVQTDLTGEVVEGLSTMSIRQGGGFIDNIEIAIASEPCPADVAPPMGVLDLFDVNEFVTGFIAGDPVADIAEPLGTLDLQDVSMFIDSFVAGCP